MAEDHEARLTILERAQILYDATLRRHGDMLETHAETIPVLRGIQERHARLLETLTTIAAQQTERMTTLQQTLDAIKDLLDRGNER